MLERVQVVRRMKSIHWISQLEGHCWPWEEQFQERTGDRSQTEIHWRAKLTFLWFFSSNSRHTSFFFFFFLFLKMSNSLWIKVLMFSPFSLFVNCFLNLILSDVTSSARSSLNTTCHAPYWISLYIFSQYPFTDSHSMSISLFE